MANLLPAKDVAPGQVHALIVGTSTYPFADPAEHKFGVEPLSSGARSASVFAAWLVTEYSRRDELASLRVLLSPSDGEQIAPPIAELLAELPENTDYSSTLANLKVDFRDFYKASKFPESTMIVYLAGHGVQVSAQGATVLLHDYLAQSDEDDFEYEELARAIDAGGAYASMNGTEYAQNQFWFVDACRQPAAQRGKFEELSGGFCPRDKPKGEAHVSPIFYAAASGTEAFAKVGGVSIFSEALKWSLEGHAARFPDGELSSKFHVSPGALIDSLTPKVAALAAEHDIKQSVDPAGKCRAAVMHEYDTPPPQFAAILQQMASGAAERRGGGMGLRGPGGGAEVDLLIQFDVASYHLRDHMPWAVRHDGAVVGEGKGDGFLSLAPGEYELVTPLPDGERITAVELVDVPVEITVKWEPPTTPEPDDESSDPTPGAKAWSVTNTTGATVAEAGGQYVVQPDGPLTAVPTAQVELAEGATLTVSLPVNPRGGYPENACIMLVNNDDQMVVRFAPERNVGATLLGYLETSQVATARTISLTSSDALMGKYQDPAAAALGGLTMDRFGEIDHRSGWVDNLARDFAWLPDGAILNVKLQVEAGEDESVELLDELLAATATRPLYTDALLLAIQQLKRWDVPEERADQVRDRLVELRSLSARRVVSSVVLITEGESDG